ncbi:MAG: hypothetical protein ACI977_000524, partial [Candidatus Nanohaloarchaea archaeon]
ALVSLVFWSHQVNKYSMPIVVIQSFLKYLEQKSLR